MYKKMLAAVNEHLNSEVTARYAVNVAKTLDAKLFICFIAEKGMDRSRIAAAQDAMQRLFNEARDLGIDSEAITETGDAVEEIGRIVRHEKIGIAFASTRREDIKRRFYTGTIARKLLLRLPCSVALMRVVHTGRVRPKKVLVPLKARIDHVKERASFVAAMAGAFSSQVYIFHVPKRITKFFHGEVHLTPDEWQKRLPADISKFMEHLREQKIESESTLSPGRTGRNISIEAFAKRHDVIIMGASERSLWTALVLGNPVEVVLRETPCDLIILKPRHEG